MQTDNDLRKKALMDAMGGSPLPSITPENNTGISGGMGVLGGTPEPAAPDPIAAAPIAAPKPTADYSRLMGYDAGKINDPNKHDFKYDTLRTLSQFDPRQGFTPDVIDALNKLDYGTFSGSGDKLSLSGAKNAKDAADFANQDWIYAHKAQNDATKWNFGGGGAAPTDAAPQAGGGGGFSLPAFGGASLDGALSGDPLAKIQQALAQMSASRPNFDALLQQLGGAQ